jgi:hypothetical protein
LILTNIPQTYSDWFLLSKMLLFPDSHFLYHTSHFAFPFCFSCFSPSRHFSGVWTWTWKSLSSLPGLYSLFHVKSGGKASHLKIICGECNGNDLAGIGPERIEVIAWLFSGGNKRNHKADSLVSLSLRKVLFRRGSHFGHLCLRAVALISYYL